jgi:rhodanese-related sulfurtransferase
MVVKELDFQESLDFVNKHRTKLVWLGKEPVDYIRELLDLDSSKMIDADPNSIMYADKEEVARFKDHVFVCYRGNTSRYVSNAIKDKAGIESVSMKGGVTAVVGEIF